MAAPAFSVTCGYAGYSSPNNYTPALIGKLVWQEAATTGTQSTNRAPGAANSYGPPIFEVYAAADSWFSYGAAPNSAGAVRVLVLAGTVMDFIAEPGDYFMWQAA